MSVRSINLMKKEVNTERERERKNKEREKERNELSLKNLEVSFI